MRKPFNKESHHRLEAVSKRNHNKGLPDPRITALVQFLARCAAEEDFEHFCKETAPNSNGGDVT